MNVPQQDTNKTMTRGQAIGGTASLLASLAAASTLKAQSSPAKERKRRPIGPVRGTRVRLAAVINGDNWLYYGHNGYGQGTGLGTLDVANFAAYFRGQIP